MSNDRRQNFRFSVQPELRKVWMTARGERIPAEIIEQSAGGFRISVAVPAKLAVNDPVELETWAGTCAAVVAYVEDVGNCRRVGLERTSDEMPRRGGWLRALWLRGKPAKGRSGNLARRRLVLGGSLIGALLAAGGLSIYLAAEDRMAAPAGARAPAGEAPLLAGATEARQATGDKQPPAGDASPAQDIAQDPISQLERLISLQKRDVAAGLELSEYQKLQISRLVADTSRSLNRLQSRRGAKTPVERKQKIAAMLARADERAQEILTPPQRGKWLGESTAPATAAGGSTVAASSSAE